MKDIRLFNVAPSIPKDIRFLEVLARNLWWSWNADAISLFRRIDRALWYQCRHNPLRLFSRIAPEQLEALSRDKGFLTHLDGVRQRFENEVLKHHDGAPHEPARDGIAYFSLEYGIHESLRLYSGGLGCLAGDHLKSASDHDVPLVAVGLLYRQGYFQQYLDDEGWQREVYPEIEMHCQPIAAVLDDQHQPVVISLPLPEHRLHAQIWRVHIGRVPLFLLDTNITANPPPFRNITAQLYGGDHHMRIRQELLLGVGGIRALAAMGYAPRACHLNEGHAAFLGLGRIAALAERHGIDGDAAFELMSRTNVFTTHTPVPAGNETFPVEVLKPYLAALEPETGLAPETVCRWGQAPDADPRGDVSMTILGLQFADGSNGVSRLHGDVARRMWEHLWPGRPRHEIPIGHITNGVHSASWLSTDLATLFDRYLGSGWRDNPEAPTTLAGIDRTPDEELWRVHEGGRARLIRAARELGERQFAIRNASRQQIDGIKSIFDHNCLTLGFARRFASYKRATLLLRDPQRLQAMLNHEDMPIQIIFAGKAHPADEAGKSLIREIVAFSNRPEVRHRVLFLEDYDILVARYLVQGVDVWLNNPRRPQEASGTSGMKAALNGGLHCSVLDGWWDEGYTPQTGWAIGGGEEFRNTEYQDQVESAAMFNLLENEVIPVFYERDANGIPSRWVSMLKASIKMALGVFGTHRMLREYRDNYYTPAMKAYDDLTADDARRARALVEQRARFNELWHKQHLTLPVPDRDLDDMHVGDTLTVTTLVKLAGLDPDEVAVELYYGPTDSHGVIVESDARAMDRVADLGDGVFRYRQTLTCTHPGRYGLTARVVPRGDAWSNAIPGFITWANGG